MPYCVVAPTGFHVQTEHEERYIRKILQKVGLTLTPVLQAEDDMEDDRDSGEDTQPYSSDEEQKQTNELSHSTVIKRTNSVAGQNRGKANVH